MIQCSFDDNGNYTLQNYSDTVCWQGFHIIHGALSVLFNVIYTSICLVVVLNYYENRMTSENPTARFKLNWIIYLICIPRENSRGDVNFILNKISLQIAFSFFPVNISKNLCFKVLEL